MAEEQVLQVEGLTKTFGRHTVVNDISFDVKRGEIFGFLGPNGAGKTTTIRMALGIFRPDSGSVSILGSPPDRNVLKGVGYLPEERGLPRKIRVLDALRYLGRLKGLTKTEAEDRATELLKRVNLDEHQSKTVEDLSRGMTQLVQFVAAIVHNPKFIILDEPFAGLDPLNTELMKEILLERKRTVALAESCTGGLLARLITDVPGSSDYFRGGLVAYSNEWKQMFLDVPAATLAKHGAVSRETALTMAVNVRRIGGADYGVAITGVAGPGGGSKAKPVGLVYIALADANGAACWEYNFPGEREMVRTLSARAALNHLRLALLDASTTTDATASD